MGVVFLLGKFVCVVVGGDEGLGGFIASVVTPVGLHEDGVDLFEVDGFFFGRARLLGVRRRRGF